jgi:uncharacterized protein YndB with AHSA1/START domain
MPTYRIYVMYPPRPGGAWHVSVNGSDGESFTDETDAVRSARDLSRSLIASGHEAEIRQEGEDGVWRLVAP